MAKWSTFRETFDANVLNTTQWPSTFGTVAASGGALVLTVNSGASNYSGLSTNTFDLTDSYCFSQLVNSGNQALTSFEIFMLQMRLDANNGVSWILNNNTLRARRKVAGVNTDVATTAFDANVHKYFRIREHNNFIYWDYATDLPNWVNLTSFSVASLFAITALTNEITAGTFGAEASGTTATIDNINVGTKTVVSRPIRPRPFAPGRAR